MIACVGSPLRSDDQAGLLLYNLLKDKGLPIVECEYGLENCMLEISEYKPEKLLIIDAVYSEKLEPGDLVLLDENSIREELPVTSTHNIPLKQVLALLKHVAGVKEIYLLGVQVKSIELGDRVSPEVCESIKKLAIVLEKTYRECRKGD